MLNKRQKKDRRHKRVRAKIKGTGNCPRLCVFRSAKHIYAQLVNDEKGITIVAASDRELEPKADRKKQEEGKRGGIIDRTGKVNIAYNVGKLLAGKAIDKNIKKVVFDRGGFRYQGRVKAVADGAREGGLKF